MPAPTPSNGKIAKAVAATAASTLVVTGLAFLLIQRWIVAKRKREKGNGTNGNYGHGGGRPILQSRSRSEFTRYSGDLKGFIVDENGLDVLYWRKLERKNSSSKKGLRKEVLRNQKIDQEEEEEDDNEGNRRRKNEPIQEIPLLRGKSSTSHVKVVADHAPQSTVGIVFKEVQQPGPSSRSSSSTSSAPPPSSPPTPPPRPPPPQPIWAIPNKKAPSTSTSPLPPPPPPIPVKKSTPPAPPAPPPPKARSLNSIPKPPPGPKGKQGNSTSKPGEQSAGDGQVKLKPLHWDKVNTNAEHSMVWDRINDNGSFR